jgi:hypothetical protein
MLQLVQRYHTWVEQGMSTRLKAASTVEQQSAGKPSVATTESVGGGAEGEAGRSTEVAAVSPSWLSSLPTEDLSVLVCDLTKVSELLSSNIHDALRQHLAPLPDAACASACKVLISSARSLSILADGVLDRMTHEVAERCVTVVKQLKGITATYRMTTKGPPTRHSHYVTGALAPLRSVLDSDRCRSLLPLAFSERLTAAVADVVNVRYQQLADELLKTVRKTEESLKRLKKATADAAGETLAPSAGEGLH